MPTSPDTIQRADDQLISHISAWLGRHMENEELRGKLVQTGTDELEPGQAEAVQELIEELAESERRQRGHAEMVARETIEVLALGE
jgi:hypothetical protein